MVTFGEYPTLGLKAARARADIARGLLANGIDPGAEKRTEKQSTPESLAKTFETVAREWFEEFGAELSESHRDRQLRRLEIHVFPWLGSNAIAEIKPLELLEVLRRVKDGGALETAHRIKFLCGQIFRYAVVTEQAERDITQDLKGALPAQNKGVFAAVTEPSEIGPLLKTIYGYSGTLPVRCALKLAPLVFCRPGELRQAAWSQIDFDSAEWRFKASKRKANNETAVPDHIVPLSTQAIEILKELQPLTGNGLYIFPSLRSAKGDRPMSENTVNGALRRLDIPKEKMCGHGFRAMARTVLDEVLNYPVDIIEHQLAHTVRDPNGRSYNRTSHLPQRKLMMQAWADYLDGLRNE